MGVYIPNMKKPKRCVDCVCNNDDVMCNATHKWIDWQSEQVEEDCPIIEIDDEIWDALKPKVDTMSMALKGWKTDEKHR
jgi:hypothetical protein